jgi:DNA-binding response OmpR family regulator
VWFWLTRTPAVQTADDYVEVPFSDLALVARTRAILRRHARGIATAVKSG